MKLTAVSRPMRDLLRQARRYAAVDATVLITGETGVGKDALSRFLHSSGTRRREPFIPVDCPALPETREDRDDMVEVLLPRAAAAAIAAELEIVAH